MKGNILFLVSITLLLLNVSCKNTTTPLIATNLTDFPNNVGNKWVYSYYDSLSNKSDYLTVTIVGQTPDKLSTIWQFKYSDRIDTQYVTFSGDTVRFDPHISSPWSSYNNIFLFPLQVGNGWKDDYLLDSTFVAEINSIIVPAGSFMDAYKIVESWGGFNDYGSIISWFVPKVGIVRRYHRGISFGEANDTFSLLSYNIN
jgi:hypothetical protein